MVQIVKKPKVTEVRIVAEVRAITVSRWSCWGGGGMGDITRVEGVDRLKGDGQWAWTPKSKQARPKIPTLLNVRKKMASPVSPVCGWNPEFFHVHNANWGQLWMEAKLILKREKVKYLLCSESKKNYFKLFCLKR
jgi:hypothetical protein